MKASVWVTLVICSFLPRSGLAARPLFADPRETFGAVRGPAQLPAGALAVYGYLGAPELGLGLRQGFEPLEAELVLRGDYLDLSFAAEALLRRAVYEREGLGIAPYLGLGFVANSGTTYIDPLNFAYVGIRARGGVIASFKVAPTLQGLAELELPFDRQLDRPDGYRFMPRLSVGAELFVADDVTLSLKVLGGLDLLQDPQLVSPTTRAAFGIQLGAGYRLF